MPVKRWPANEAQGQADPFRRHRWCRHERHRRGAAQSRLSGQWFGPEPFAGDAAPGKTGGDGLRRSPGRACRACRLRGGVDRRAPRQPRGAAGAGASRAGGAAGADAGRADEAQAGGGHRRHARQDHHHQPGRQHPGQGRHGPDLRDRGAPQQCRRQCPAGQWRLHRRRGGRVGCFVPEPAADDRRRHQHRRRSHGHLWP